MITAALVVSILIAIFLFFAWEAEKGKTTGLKEELTNAIKYINVQKSDNIKSENSCRSKYHELMAKNQEIERLSQKLFLLKEQGDIKDPIIANQKNQIKFLKNSIQDAYRKVEELNKKLEPVTGNATAKENYYSEERADNLKFSFKQLFSSFTVDSKINPGYISVQVSEILDKKESELFEGLLNIGLPEDVIKNVFNNDRPGLDLRVGCYVAGVDEDYLIQRTYLEMTEEIVQKVSYLKDFIRKAILQERRSMKVREVLS